MRRKIHTLSIVFSMARKKYCSKLVVHFVYGVSDFEHIFGCGVPGTKSHNSQLRKHITGCKNNCWSFKKKFGRNNLNFLVLSFEFIIKSSKNFHKIYLKMRRNYNTNISGKEIRLRSPSSWINSKVWGRLRLNLAMTSLIPSLSMLIAIDIIKISVKNNILHSIKKKNFFF